MYNNTHISDIQYISSTIGLITCCILYIVTQAAAKLTLFGVDYKEQSNKYFFNQVLWMD